MKTACVTGAASGIGFAIAKALAKLEYAVLIADIRSESVGHEIICGFDGSGHLYLQADIANSGDRQRILDTIREQFGRLDLLVNNAGIAPRFRADILDMTEQSYDLVMSVNLKAPFFLTQILARYMIELVQKNVVQNPKIVNISSISAYTSSTTRGEYCISKAGLNMVTKLFADRLAEYGINVYEIRPGIIRTPMTEPVAEKYNNLIFHNHLLPIARWGTPEDIAAVIEAIVSGAFEYSTGEVFNVDGGFHLRRL